MSDLLNSVCYNSLQSVASDVYDYIKIKLNITEGKGELILCVSVVNKQII